MLLSLKSIKVIVWDLDGTIFFSPKSASAMKFIFLKIYQDFKRLPKKVAGNNFASLIKKKRWGLAVSQLTGLPEKEILFRLESKIDRKIYAKRDKNLLKIFKQLKNFRHLILSNASYQNTIDVLSKLGFSKKKDGSIGPFEKIFALDKSSPIKPYPGAFKRVLNYTKLPSDKHLMVGDFLDSDIVPAKKLKFVTCFIGYNEKADYNVSSVYQVPSLFYLRYNTLNTLKDVFFILYRFYKKLG